MCYEDNLLCAADSDMGGAMGSGHAGYYPSSMSPTSSNPANHSAATHLSDPRGLGQHGMTTFENQTVDATWQPPAQGASSEDVKAWVEHQLDRIGSTPLIGRFVMLGPSERRRGGVPSPLVAVHRHFTMPLQAVLYFAPVTGTSSTNRSLLDTPISARLREHVHLPIPTPGGCIAGPLQMVWLACQCWPW